MSGSPSRTQTQTIKARHEGRLHVVSFPADSVYDEVLTVMLSRFGEGVILTHTDGEGDVVTLRSDAEYQSALRLFYDTHSASRPPPFPVQVVPDSRGSAASAALREFNRVVEMAAVRLTNNAMAAEEQITRLVQGAAERARGRMVGLEYRFKTRASMERKLHKKLKGRIDDVVGNPDPGAFSSAIKDALRYTVQFETDAYVAGVNAVLSALNDAQFVDPDATPPVGSFALHQAKNYWISGDVSGGPSSPGPSSSTEGPDVSELDEDAAFRARVAAVANSDGMVSVKMHAGAYVTRRATASVYAVSSRGSIRKGDEYQGINVVLRNTNTGMMWELQFHTPESLEVKHASHKVYEKFRVAVDPMDLHEMYMEMVEMWDSVPRPAGVERLGEPVGLEPAPQLPPIPEDKMEAHNAVLAAKADALKEARAIRAAWIQSGAEDAVTEIVEDLTATYRTALTDLFDRLLGKYQLRAKIQELAEAEALSLEEAAARVPDALTYTVILQADASYVSTVLGWVDAMEAAGYVLEGAVSDWDALTGLSSIWLTPPDVSAPSPPLRFSIRFHTMASRALAKLLALHGDNDEDKEVAAARKAVVVPPGVGDVIFLSRFASCESER